MASNICRQREMAYQRKKAADRPVSSRAEVACELLQPFNNNISQRCVRTPASWIYHRVGMDGGVKTEDKMACRRNGDAHNARRACAAGKTDGGVGNWRGAEEKRIRNIS